MLLCWPTWQRAAPLRLPSAPLEASRLRRGAAHLLPLFPGGRPRNQQPALQAFPTSPAWSHPLPPDRRPLAPPPLLHLAPPTPDLTPRDPKRPMKRPGPGAQLPRRRRRGSAAVEGRLSGSPPPPAAPPSLHRPTTCAPVTTHRRTCPTSLLPAPPAGPAPPRRHTTTAHSRSRKPSTCQQQAAAGGMQAARALPPRSGLIRHLPPPRSTLLTPDVSAQLPLKKPSRPSRCHLLTVLPAPGAAMLGRCYHNTTVHCARGACCARGS